MWPNPQETADLVTFTEEILNWKLHLLSSATYTYLEKRKKFWPNRNMLRKYNSNVRKYNFDTSI